MSAHAVTDPAVMLALQGDKVLVRRTGAGVLHMLTIVRVVTGNQKDVKLATQELRLTNRENKSGKPDWTLTQALCDSLKPAPANTDGARWTLAIK